MADRVLSDLHEHRVAGLERQLDAARLAFETSGIPVDLAGVEHAVAGLADVHKCGLHAGQHVLHAAKVDVADGLYFLNVGDVMLDQNIVFHHGNLGVMFLLTHHHQAVHVLAACEEVLFHELALAAALTAVVTAALLLGLETSGALHISDLVDVLLLAGASDQRLFAVLTLVVGALAVLAATTATATASNGLLLIVLIAITVMIIAIVTTAGTRILGIVLGGIVLAVGTGFAA